MKNDNKNGNFVGNINCFNNKYDITCDNTEDIDDINLHSEILSQELNSLEAINYTKLNFLHKSVSTSIQ